MEHEAFYRLAFFFGILFVMILLEIGIPKRQLSAGRKARWGTNFSFAVINSFLIRVMALSSVPLVPMSVALVGEHYGFGLFRLFEMPYWLEILIALLVLDFAIYLQHWASHRFPMLWRVHRMHHSDLDVDVTTAVRFHPIEIGLSMLYKTILVLILGFDVLSVLLFEIILNGMALFNHSNIALPKWLDKILRIIIVTPDMHRVHHSIERQETDSNYGFNLAIWDRLFRTYIAQPNKGHQNMEIGLPPYHKGKLPTKFAWSFKLPFSSKN